MNFQSLLMIWQVETATRRLRGAEGAEAVGDAFRQAEALRAQESIAERSLQVPVQQVEEKPQVYDDGMRALLQQMEKLQEENEAAHALLDKRLQKIEQTLQQKDQATPALLDDRLKRLEERMGELSEQMNLFAKKDGEASAEMKPLMNQLDKRLMNLEANVQRVLQQLPSSEHKPSFASPPTCNSTSVPSSAPSATPSSAPTSLPSSSPVSLPSSTPASIPTSSPVPLSSSAPTPTPSPSRLGEELFAAARDGSVERVRSLLDAGADVNYNGTEGRSPLMEAVFRKVSCNEALVTLLLQRGALVDAVNKDGVTPLHYAAIYDTSARCVALLAGAGADVHARDKLGWTPLLGAASNDGDAKVRALLGAGADANAANKDGWTPLHWAANYNNEANVRALLAAGARKDARAWGRYWKDKTPFDLATERASGTIQDLLRP